MIGVYFFVESAFYSFFDMRHSTCPITYPITLVMR